MKALIAAVAALAVAGCAIEDSHDVAEEERSLSDPPAVASCTAAHAEGKPCNDGLFCTVDDRCHAGVCLGEQRPCGGVVGFCAVATCDEARDACVAAPRAPGCVDRCATAPLLRIYRRSWQRGFEAVSRAWEHRGDCSRGDDFVDRIMRRFEAAQRQGDPEADVRLRRRCRKAGVLDGAYAALEDIQDHCDQVCFLDGELVGTLAATSYCELAIEADQPLDVAEWIRGPLDTCGFGYETACDATFIGESLAYVGDDGACEPFTAGAYEVPWDRSRDQSCDYRNRPDAP